VGEVQAGGLDQIALGADALEEHHQLELEEDDRIDARSSPVGIEAVRPIADEGQVERGFQVAVEVVGRNQVLQRDGDRRVEAAGLGRTEHRAPQKWAPHEPEPQEFTAAPPRLPDAMGQREVPWPGPA